LRHSHRQPGTGREGPQPPSKRRRKRWMFAAAAMLTALLLVAGLTVGFAWYLTSRLVAVTHVHDTYPLQVLAIGTRDATVTLTAGPDAAEPGSFRLAWSGGYGIAGPVTASGNKFVTRHISDVTGHLTVGQQAGIEPGRYTGDPMTALGVHYATVRVPTPLGKMPAWQISGHRSTWVILVHGLGGNRADTMAAIPALHLLGFPILAITYRNDVGAPASPDHQSHLGATEWHDIDSAVRYATGHGASGVVLFGYSLGAAMAMVTAEDSPVRGRVRSLVLDSPILDWQATLTYQGRRHGLPTPLISLAEMLLAWRTGLNFAQFNQLQHETSLHVPVLLIQGTTDTIVPPGLADAFARRKPRLVTYLRVAGADHVSAMDTDPGAYRAALARFLAGYP
jgi:pimeloyl-ACP methyl ester carboxylesterase